MLGYARRSTVVPWARPIPYAGGLHARAPQPVPIRPFRRRVVTARAVLLESPERRGRPPKWPARRVTDAVFYLLRSGCAWRMLPKEYPPWQSVYYHFWKWRRDGRLRQAHDRLREEVREAEGRKRDPSGAVIDSQAVKGTGVGGPERGYDGAKRLSGRKRHLLVDTGGLVLGASVHAASLHDREGAQRLLSDELKESLPQLELLWADGAYTGGFRRWAEEERGWQVEVPRHRDRQLWRYGLLREAPRVHDLAEEVGRGEDLRLARPSSAAGERLRAAAGEWGGDDIVGHEPDYAAQARQRSRLKCLKKG